MEKITRIGKVLTVYSQNDFSIFWIKFLMRVLFAKHEGEILSEKLNFFVKIYLKFNFLLIMNVCGKKTGVHNFALFTRMKELCKNKLNQENSVKQKKQTVVRPSSEASREQCSLFFLE